MSWTEEELISNKWIEIDYLDLKGQIKTEFKYWEKNEPSHRKPKRRWNNYSDPMMFWKDSDQIDETKKKILDSLQR